MRNRLSTELGTLYLERGWIDGWRVCESEKALAESPPKGWRP